MNFDASRPLEELLEELAARLDAAPDREAKLAIVRDYYPDDEAANRLAMFLGEGGGTARCIGDDGRPISRAPEESQGIHKIFLELERAESKPPSA